MERKPIREFDAHRLIGLICRYPKHKWHLRVWEFMWIKRHTDQCYECQKKIDELLVKHPRIGMPPDVN